MTWNQMTEVVTSCEDFCKVYGRVPYFYITGGDPILHPDFWKLMEINGIAKIEKNTIYLNGKSISPE